MEYVNSMDYGIYSAHNNLTSRQVGYAQTGMQTLRQ